MINNVLIIGAGAWGGAIAQLVANNILLEGSKGAKVVLYGNEQFNIKQKHPKLGIFLNQRIEYVQNFLDVAKILKTVECIFLVVPSNALLSVTSQIKESLDSVSRETLENSSKRDRRSIPIVICTKGLDGKNDCLYSDSLHNIFTNHANGAFEYEIGVLSGPNFAKQVAHGFPAVTNIAFENIETAKDVARLCRNDAFAVKCTKDLRGAQILGAYKNVMALAMGMLEGAGYSSNAIAKYLCSCISELEQLLKDFGGNKETILTPCGIGDIYLTCTNKESRNTSFGLNLGKYNTFKEYCDSGYISNNNTDTSNITVEGINAVKSLKQVAGMHKLKLSSIDVLYNILFEGHNIQTSIQKLLSN